MRERFESFTAEKKPEIITNANEAREAMRDFWRREEDSKTLELELELKEAEYVKDLMKSGYEMEALRKGGAENRKESSADPSRFIFASKNETKRRIVAEASERQKLFLQETMFSPTQEEEEVEHGILETLMKEQKSKRGLKTIRSYEPAFFSLDIAEAKVLKMRETYKRIAIVGADIVVLRGSRVLEKPKDMEDAFEMIKAASGKKITVSFGVVLLTPTKFGKTILIKEGGCFNIKPRKFSEREAQEYLDKSGKAILAVVGGIDYASPLAQILLSDKSIEAAPLQLGRKFGESKKSILISSIILPQLKDYFMGVPKELIQEMIRRGKLLQGGNF